MKCSISAIASHLKVLGVYKRLSVAKSAHEEGKEGKRALGLGPGALGLGATRPRRLKVTGIREKGKGKGERGSRGAREKGKGKKRAGEQRGKSKGNEGTGNGYNRRVWFMRKVTD